MTKYSKNILPFWEIKRGRGPITIKVLEQTILKEEKKLTRTLVYLDQHIAELKECHNKRTPLQFEAVTNKIKTLEKIIDNLNINLGKLYAKQATLKRSGCDRSTQSNNKKKSQ